MRDLRSGHMNTDSIRFKAEKERAPACPASCMQAASRSCCETHSSPRTHSASAESSHECARREGAPESSTCCASAKGGSLLPLAFSTSRQMASAASSAASGGRQLRGPSSATAASAAASSLTPPSPSPSSSSSSRMSRPSCSRWAKWSRAVTLPERHESAPARLSNPAAAERNLKRYSSE